MDQRNSVSSSSSKKVSPRLLGRKQPSPLMGYHAVVRSRPSSAGSSPLMLPNTTGAVAEAPSLSLPHAAGDSPSSKKVRKRDRKQQQQQQASPPSDAVTAVSKELPDLTAFFSRVELAFQLDKALSNSQQPRTTLTPRDLGNLMMWSLPVAVPIVESPRVFFVKNRSQVRDVVVVYVNGWSYDQMMCTGVGLPRKEKKTDAIAAADDDNDNEDEDEVWNDRICSAMLQPIRKGKCWARGSSGTGSVGGVQYAPLYLPSTKRTLEQEIFWRSDAPRLPRNNAPGSSPAEEGCVDTTRVTPSTGEAKGVGRLFQHAVEIESNASSPVAPASPLMTIAEVPAEHADTNTNAVSSPVGVSEEGGTSLWLQLDVLKKYALHFPEHHVPLMELGFVLNAPMVLAPGEGSTPVESMEWARFEDKTPTEAEDTSKNPPKVFAFDCEMVLTEGQVSALARATLVDVHTGFVVFDMLVKPRAPIINYLTRFSGIDEAMLTDVTATIEDCQAALKQHISSQDFLVGHSLENDLKACKMLPTCYILDSAWLFPHPSGLPYKNALRFLAQRYLHRKIQQGSHDSAIDALVSAELVHLKMKKGPEFGIRSRVSVLGLIAAGAQQGEGVNGESAPSSSSSIAVKVRLFDDAQLLSEILPKQNASCIESIPVRHDEDACRKIVRALQKRGEEKPVGESGGESDSSSFSLMWVQFSDTAIDVVKPPMGGEGLTEEEANAYEALQHKKVWEVNNRVMRVIEASPEGAIVLVVAAECRGEEAGNHLSRAQGAVFGIVKDKSAPGPARPISMAVDTQASPEGGDDTAVADEAVAKRARVEDVDASLPTPPACQQQ